MSIVASSKLCATQSWFRRHATAVQRIRGEPRPEDKPITHWIARGDAQCERIARKTRLADRQARGDRGGERGGCYRPGHPEEPAAAEGARSNLRGGARHGLSLAASAEGRHLRHLYNDLRRHVNDRTRLGCPAARGRLPGATVASGMGPQGARLAARGFEGGGAGGCSYGHMAVRIKWPQLHRGSPWNRSAYTCVVP